LHRVPFPLAGCGREITIGRMARRSLASTWLPAVAWAAVIFALSSIPALSTGLGTWDLVLRKLGHFAEYAVLGLLLMRATRALPTFVLGALYAVSDEVHQSFVRGREAAAGDVAIDVAGVVLGILASRRLAR
jgi:VanZ family protein